MGGGLPVRFRGLPVFQIALFGLYWPNYVTVTMISGPTPDRRPPVRAWAKPCPGGRGREGLGPVRPRVSASRHGFQLPDTASSFRPVSRCSKWPPCPFLWPHRPAIARGVVCTGHARRMGDFAKSSGVPVWKTGTPEAGSGPEAGAWSRVGHFSVSTKNRENRSVAFARFYLDIRR